MGRHYTGRDGALFVDGAKVAKVQDWSFTGSVGSLDTTTLGDFAASSINGNLSYSGSATVLLYEDDIGTLEGLSMLSPVFRTTINDPDQTLVFDLRMQNGSKLRRFQFQGRITNAGTASTSGEIMTVPVSFVATGALTTVTL